MKSADVIRNSCSKTVYRYLPRKWHSKINARLSVEAWWRKRLSDGCQVEDLEMYEKGYDYKERPNARTQWVKAIVTSVLYGDYVRFGDPPRATRIQFMYHFHRLIDGKAKSKRVSLWTKGKVFLRPLRRFFIFEEIEHYRGKNDG